MVPIRTAAAGTLLAAALGCTRPAGPPPGAALGPAPDTATSPLISSSRLPPVPEVRGPLQIHVVYPSPQDRVDAGDSSFMFGSVGSGDARLTINGQPVTVWPNGAWLAWIAFPPDSVMRFDLRAVSPTDSTSLLYEARRVPRFVPPPGVWVDSTSMSPRGRAWWPRDEYLTLSVRAAEGATVQLRFPNGDVVPFVPHPRYDEVAWGIRAFDRDTANLAVPLRSDRYVAALRGRPVGPPPGPVLGPAPTYPPPPPPSPIPPADTGVVRLDSGLVQVMEGYPVLEVIRGMDTARATWPLRLGLLDSLPILMVLDDDTAGTGTTDGITVGRALPGGTYHWFFPNGTRATVTGRVNGDLRLRLSRESIAWVAASEAHPLARGLPAPRAVVGSTTLTPMADRVALRIPLSQRVPYQVVETEYGIELRLYSAVGDVNWMRYGGTDPLVTTMAWAQDKADEVTLSIRLAQPVWGYRLTWRQNDLILEIRRPPELDRGNPLKGVTIVVDPGHPPVGATGPTGLREPDANLAVSLKLRDLLARSGARVIMTRTTDVPVDLYPRVRLADSVNADLLISIHNNALPDGVNPFTNNGSSVFYNHPRSVPLAMAIQRALVEKLGLRNLGVGRGDLALVRPTWMPAILSEGLFMMLPDQEAALRADEGQELYAEAVFEGVREFLRERGQSQP